MKMKWIPIVAALALGACTLTSQERTDLVGAGLDVAVVGVEILHDVGVDVLTASESTIKIVAAVCGYIEAGSPVVVVAINIVVARLNDGAVDPVTVDEFTSGLAQTCRLIEAVLTAPADDA